MTSGRTGGGQRRGSRHALPRPTPRPATLTLAGSPAGHPARQDGQDNVGYLSRYHACILLGLPFVTQNPEQALPPFEHRTIIGSRPAELLCVSAHKSGSCRSLPGKGPPDFRRNLGIGHFVGAFDAHDASVEVVSFETLLQFALRLTGTKKSGW